ncbi:MAG TPA: sialidase family protein [Thermoleophilaceae bacterium]
MRRTLLALGVAALACTFASAAYAAPLTVTAPVNISTPTPFPPGCGGPTEGNIPGANFNFPNSEVEPWLAVRPTNANDVAGMWQQDRWSDGGAHGLLAAVSHDGGATWAYSAPHFSNCAGGTAANGGNFGRSSDPWVSWAPNGDLWSISLSVDRTTTRNAVLVAKMGAGSSTWTEPTTVRFDSSEKTGIPLGNNFNDKESLTADPTDASGNLVYAVWDRIVAPSSNAAASAFEHNKFAFRGPTWFARTTEGASATPDWERARKIYDPGEQNQTISNQIVVLPNGTLVDGFMLIKSHQNNKRSRGFSTAVIRSTDKGVTWSRRAIVVSPVSTIGETDPEPINCRPYINGNPPCTLVRSDGVIVDLAVDNSGGAHNGRIYMTWQAHDDNPHGDDLIQVAWSDDGGRTWSDPVDVNQTPPGAFTDQAFEPSIHVNSQGVVAVSYYDFRNDVSGDRRLTTDFWIVHSHDGGGTWTENHLAGPFDMHQTPYARGYFVGDYQGLDSQGSAFRNLFTLGSPGSDTVFPNPNPTDEFIDSAF